MPRIITYSLYMYSLSLSVFIVVVVVIIIILIIPTTRIPHKDSKDPVSRFTGNQFHKEGNSQKEGSFTRILQAGGDG